MSIDEKRLRVLEKQISNLRKNRKQLEIEAEHWKELRDKLNDDVKALRARALIQKQERDKINLQVADVKTTIRNLFRNMDDKRDKLFEIERELNDEKSKLPSREKIEKLLSSIEWELMTTPTMEMMKREKELIIEANKIRNRLEEHKKLESLFEKKLDSLADSKAVEMIVRRHQNDVKKLHDTSQKHHEKMIQIFNTVDAERKKADDAHKKFVEKIIAIKSINEELKKVYGEFNRIRQKDKEISEKTKVDQKMELQAKKKELKNAVKRKLESGHKLDFEELRLLYEDENEEYDNN
jgi:phosphoserine phosphatase